MISRGQAVQLALDHLRSDANVLGTIEPAGPGSRWKTAISEVCGVEDLRWRLPNIYGLPVPIESCWIAYVTGWWDGLYSSRVILIERDSGSVVYDGSAHDEG